MSTAPDLALWIALFGTSTLFSRARGADASTATHSDQKGASSYGLGIHIDQTPLGTAYGHSGYIAGYLSWVRWYAAPSVAVAIQVNTSDEARITWDGYELSDRIAKGVAAVCGR